MGYRLPPDKDFTAAFRNAATEQLEQAIRVLEDRPDGNDEAIHAFRKNLKRLRTLYRLVVKAAPDFQKQENARLRDVAKSLSAMRDAAALVGTARYLKDKARSDEEAQALDRIIATLEARRAGLTKAEGGLEDKLRQAADSLHVAKAEVSKISFDGGRRKNARMLAGGWHRTARAALAAISECDGEASAAAFHQLRKRGQDYLQYQALLRDLWPSALQAKQAAAKQLVDLLGHVHDLDVLCELVETEPQLFASNDDLARLLDAVIAQQQTMRAEALTRARSVFADDPDEERQRIEQLWIIAGR